MAHEGNTVKVHYTGTLNDGSIFDSSEGREPLEFVMGEGQVIAGFETAVGAMQIGETRTVTIACADAYGEVNPEQIVTIDKEHFPPEIKPEVGMMLQMQTPQGPMPVRVDAIDDDGVRLDANHPLAGEDLTFELTLVASS